MKTVLLDSDLILQGLSDEGNFHQQFVVLWELLQTAQLQGFITPRDQVQLQQRLEQNIGYQSSQLLITAVNRILQVWSGDRTVLLDAIITEHPQRFSEWDRPTFTVSEFLTRYELDLLLSQTPEPIQLTQKFAIASNHPFHKAVAVSLLLLPVLLEVWLRRQHLAELLAVITPPPEQSPQPQRAQPPSPLYRQVEPVSQVARSPVATAAATATLSLTDLPGLEVSVENDLPLNVQLDSQNSAAVVRLGVTDAVLQSGNDIVLATLYRSDTGQAIAQIVATPAGVAIVAHASEPTTQASNRHQGSLVATIQHNEAGHLTAVLSAMEPALPAADGGDRAAISSTSSQASNPLVAVRYVDQYVIPVPAAPEVQQGIEIRFEVNPTGAHQATIYPWRIGEPEPSQQPSFPQPFLVRESERVEDPSTTPTSPMPDNDWVMNDFPRSSPSSKLGIQMSPGDGANGIDLLPNGNGRGSQLIDLDTPVMQVLDSIPAPDPGHITADPDSLFAKPHSVMVLPESADELLWYPTQASAVVIHPPALLTVGQIAKQPARPLGGNLVGSDPFAVAMSSYDAALWSDHGFAEWVTTSI